jgi:hypothetical protein
MNEEDSYNGTDDKKWFTWRYMRLMAKELAKAIEEGQPLRLGRLTGHRNSKFPESAIFICNFSQD